MGTSEFTVADHFTGKAAVAREVYDRLLAALRRIGPVHEDPKKTSIHLVRTSALVGVAVRKDYLVLSLKSDHRIDSPRVTKSEQLSARRFHHTLKLASPSEINAELRQWLKDAYEISG